jgi:hypothetical protein
MLLKKQKTSENFVVENAENAQKITIFGKKYAKYGLFCEKNDLF